MPTDTETYLAEVEERASAYQTYLSQDDLRDPEVYERLIEASQTDVTTLVEMLRRFRIRYPRPRHMFCRCGPCTHYTLLDRIARAAMEKQPSTSTKK